MSSCAKDLANYAKPRDENIFATSQADSVSIQSEFFLIEVNVAIQPADVHKNGSTPRAPIPMKLRQLQCFCAVADAGFNISRSSSILNATQPAIGKQLRQLEDALGVNLFLRQGGRLVGMTEAGERTLEWARRTLQCAENLLAAAQNSDGRSGGDIELGTNHTHAKHVLVPAIVEFNRRFPNVRIGIQQGTPDQIAEMVRVGKVSVGITAAPADVPAELVVVPFLTSRQVLVMPVGHPLFDETELTLAKVAAYPLILQSPTEAQGERILTSFRHAGLNVRLAVQALDSDVKKTYVEAGLGVAIIPAFNYSATRDLHLRVRDVGHLFGPAPSAVLLRRHSYLRRHVYDFLEQIDQTLERRRIESLVFDE